MKTDSLAGKAFNEIRKKILSNQLPANTRLKEDEWAKKIGVSRMAVREALTRLLGEDLVVLGEKGGYFVKPMLVSEVHEIRELREILELGALRLAFRKMDKAKVEKLEKENAALIQQVKMIEALRKELDALKKAGSNH